VCSDGTWECDYSKVTGFVEEDTACDGLDSDCDGVPDNQEVFADISLEGACPQIFHGVCRDNQQKVSIKCLGLPGGQFQWLCDPSAVPGHVLDERFTVEADNLGVWCDGLDNDCDGTTDEFHEHRLELEDSAFQALDWSYTCPKFTGVCQVQLFDGNPQEEWIVQSDVAWRCHEGLFQCALDHNEDYEPAEESCDGKDNDCDGTTDEGMDIKNSPCLKLGVCAGKGQAYCVGGEWLCNYDKLLNDPLFEFGQETLCDGLDNNCDGAVDEGLAWTGEALEWADCPLTEKKSISGLQVTVPVLGADRFPVLPGVCGRDLFTGQTSVRMSCQPVMSGATLLTSVWKCNYDEVEDYLPEEVFVPGGAFNPCDGRDNDCNGIVDDPGQIAMTEQLEQTTCRFLGECAGGNTKAVCNVDGKSPARWSCEYDIKQRGTVQVPVGCDPDLSNCFWEETLCDSLDNDCDGVTDEFLSGRKLEMATACSSVLNKGVCQQQFLDTKCRPHPSTGINRFECDFAGVPFYAPLETGQVDLCDGKDNNCNGQTDEGIQTSNPAQLESNTPCRFKGVCATGTVATCAAGNWTCNYSQVQNHGTGYTYQVPGGALVEVQCDGLDNDCDGVVDEDLNLDLGEASGLNNPKYKSGCKHQGACRGFVRWGCSGQGAQKSWFCDYTEVLGYEPVEVSCDLVDNDCDGSVDEDLYNIGPAGANCKRLGVCAGPGVTAACITGGWVCYYDGVQHYQQIEISCDGRDNDCDGKTDFELNWRDTNACETRGVCNNPDLEALCLGAQGWSCVYAVLPGYQAGTETLCDGKDNNCNGLTDEAACKFCETCTSDGNCQLNACKTAPTGEMRCASAANRCVYIDPVDGQCVGANSGSWACVATDHPGLCQEGQWVLSAPRCTGATPVCSGGVCKACYPGVQRCNGNMVEVCAGDGSQWTQQGACPSDRICVGKGICALNNEIDVSQANISLTTDAQEPRISALKGGGFVVIFASEMAPGGVGSEVMARLYSDVMAPLGPAFIVNTFADGTQNRPAVAYCPTSTGAFVVVWESAGQDGDGVGIYGQRFSNTGTKLGNEFRVNFTTTLNQEAPEVACGTDGSFVVVWQSQITASDYDVFGRRFGSDGAALTSDIKLNTTTAQNQYGPTVASYPGLGWGTSWTSVGADADAQGVVGQRFTTALVKSGGEYVINKYETADQKAPVMGGFSGTKAGWSAVAWESWAQDGAAWGVFLQVFNASGERLFPNTDVSVNTLVTAGSQRDPSIAILSSNHVVVTWESTGLPGEDATSWGVGARVFSQEGAGLTTHEFLVNQTTLNNQQNPAVAGLETGAYAVVWTSKTSLVPQDVRVMVRVFKP
jgi:hypothetical protein